MDQSVQPDNSEEIIKLDKFLKTCINISIRNDLCQKFEVDPSEIYSVYYNYYFNDKFNRDINGIYNIDIWNITNPILISSIIHNTDDVVCISLYIPDEFLRIGTGHQNTIIIRKNENRFEHYEPNGSPKKDWFYSIVNQVKLLYYELVKCQPEMTFISSEELHPFGKIGFQSFDRGYAGEMGYCQLWCYFTIRLVMTFKTLSTKNIFSRFDLDDITLKQYRRRLKEIIRGYTYTTLKKLYYYLI